MAQEVDAKANATQRKLGISPGTYANTFAVNVLGIIVTAIQGVLLARMLGLEGRGAFQAVTYWPILISSLGLLGVNDALARRAAKVQNPGSLTPLALVLALITASISIFVCMSLLPHVLGREHAPLVAYAMFFLLFIPINHVGVNLLSIDYGSGNYAIYNLSRLILGPIFLFGLAVAWVLGTDKLLHAISALLFANAAVVAFRLWKKRNTIIGPTPPVAVAGVIRNGMPFWIAGAASILQQQADKGVLVLLMSASDIGLYIVAFSSASIIGSASAAIGTIAFSKAAKNNSGCGFESVARAFRVALILSLLGSIPLVLALPFVLPLVYGQAFAAAVNVAAILVPACVLTGGADVLRQDLCGQGRPLAPMGAALLGLLTTTIASTYFSAAHGIHGIALGALLGSLSTLAATAWLTVRHYEDAAWLKLLPNSEDMFLLARACAEFYRRFRNELGRL